MLLSCHAWRIRRGPGQIHRPVGGRPLAEGEERAAAHGAPEEGHGELTRHQLRLSESDRASEVNMYASVFYLHFTVVGRQAASNSAQLPKDGVAGETYFET